MQLLCRTSWTPVFALLAYSLCFQPSSTQAETKTIESKPKLSRFDGNPRMTPVVHLVKRLRGAVVNIHSERLVRGKSPTDLFALAPSTNRVKGMGTGIVVDPRGYVVTNHHVIDGVNLIRVRLADGLSTDARVVARDAENDLALLKIDVKKPLPVMPIGTAKDLMVGETVVAIGNAYGYDHTVTVGVVSATRRDVKLNKEISYRDLIQTDASINPGNSGGPLLNIRGELIGVNVAIRAGAQGISFAIPVDIMVEMVGRMLCKTRRRECWLGLECQDRVEFQKDFSAERSVVLASVSPDSPANKAGLQPGDVLIRVDSKPVTTTIDLERALLQRSPEQSLILQVKRGNALKRLSLTPKGPQPLTVTASESIWNNLGMRLRPVEQSKVGRANQQLQGGLFVTQIRQGGNADQAGIQAGDILIGLHQWEMLTESNVLYVLTHPNRQTFSPTRFYIVRSGQVHRGWLKLPY